MEKQILLTEKLCSICTYAREYNNCVYFVLGSKKVRECVICMAEFQVGDALRFLPCMHTYHMTCIDDWLMRSLTCPSCLEPVDAALLTSYETN